jgi:SET domain
LTVSCSDENFDGGAYYLSRFTSDDNNVVCLDRNLRVGRSVSPDAMGLGVHARRDMARGTTVISTPLVPIHRNEMDIPDGDVNSKQLMLNYAYGHPDSDLLLLPIGPVVNYLNHHPTLSNAQIRWHTVREDHRGDPTDGGGGGGGLSRRQQYHHPELLSIPGEKVARMHGRGLLMDIVATRDIRRGEEIFLDYGREWQLAWERHVAAFEASKSLMSEADRSYVSAERTVAALGADSAAPTVWRTNMEEALTPYPDNVEFFCFYQQHDDDSDDEDTDEERKNRPASRGWRKFSWNDHDRHPCFRPCTIVERRDGGGAGGGGEPTYTVEMFRSHNPRVMFYCSIG